MKRSTLNALIAQAEADFRKVGVFLPAFGSWTPQDWRAHLEETGDMRAAGLGWDVTDFGSARFEKQGLLLFTLRNGVGDSDRPGNRPYAEKIMISRRDQLTPLHRHKRKVEDIIHRAPLQDGAMLAIELFGMLPDGGVDRAGDVVAHLDGRVRRLPAGSVVRLAAGESITLFPGTYHAFWGEDGDVVVGEVSSINDDAGDNVFAEPVPRFAAIDEDAPPLRLLVGDDPASCG
ncbi:D-lyxose/D-mannose family sugar isomerase [Acetobacteraceae bacterium KSS8]|uniref:D-lyxose ketol-isomerase n=1 Tax=Endosaccharibacter trunci TaxID=2812733 RepID=A0ABT1WB09_9PROT|nr:D-lyxose/D-mannose family sugar isomerase [Acetobacteraceae bacterium KSS8]